MATGEGVEKTRLLRETELDLPGVIAAPFKEHVRRRTGRKVTGEVELLLFMSEGGVAGKMIRRERVRPNTTE